MSQAFQAVIDGNRDVLIGAGNINRRAGTVLVPVMTMAELLRWLAPRLGGARCMADVSDPNVLRLPAIDPALEAKVLAENPDTITVAGRSLTVTYDDQSPPSVQWDLENDADLSWRQLSDDGVKLPGGRMVKVVVCSRYWGERASGTDIRAVKAAMIARVNQSQWDGWSQPTMDVPTDGVVTIVEREYGTCVITGGALMAYGTLEAIPSWYQIDWYARWYRTRPEAEATRSASQATVDAERPRIEAESARSALQDLRSREHWYEIGAELRNRAETQMANRPLADMPANWIEWTTSVRALTAEAEAALAAAAAKKAEEERRLAAAEAIIKREIVPILPMVEYHEQRARAVLEMAKHMESEMGNNPAAAATLLRGELRASYGCAGRKDAIKARVPTLVETAGGSWFLGITRARDVDMWLGAAAAYLESRLPSVPVSKPAPAPAPPAQASVKTGGGLDLSGLMGNGWSSSNKGRRR